MHFKIFHGLLLPSPYLFIIYNCIATHIIYSVETASLNNIINRDTNTDL
jgi:hypothetical protein